MVFDPEEILAILDVCCDEFTFPMLDNGYFYLAATRLSLYRSETDWAMVIEVFGYSPRAGIPNTDILTFASRLHNRDPHKHCVDRQAYETYLAVNPHNELHSIYPVQEGPWQDAEDSFLIAPSANQVIVRNHAIRLPSFDEYELYGIEPEDSPAINVFEMCRFLAEIAREEVLATPLERRVNIIPEMNQILQLEEWHHPNVVDEDERPSGSETFQQLGRVLATGDVKHYRPSQPPNTHWQNWPEGGSL